MPAEGTESMLWDESTLNAEWMQRELGPETCAHSARYLKERNPRLYQAIALALGYGIPVKVLAGRLSVGENTVRAVAHQESATVEDSKQGLKDNLRKFLHGAALVLAEKLNEIPVEKLPAAIAAINQQLLLLDGQATSIVRHERGESVDDITRDIEHAQRLARGHVVDVPETGLEPEKKPSENAAPSLTDSIPLPALTTGEATGTNGWKALGEAAQLPDIQGESPPLYRPLYQSGQDGRADEGGEGGAPRAGGDLTLH